MDPVEREARAEKWGYLGWICLAVAFWTGFMGSVIVTGGLIAAGCFCFGVYAARS